MKKKALALAIAGALSVPQVAFAATDDSGMQYTSASEGFYGSLRAVFRDAGGGKKDDGAYIGTDRGSNRLGVRGSLDLGGGLTGVYRTEWGFSGDAGGNSFGTRLGYVGLKGGFGSVTFGRQWSEDYNFVTASTDLTNFSTGNFTSRTRRGNLAKYVSPDINGFQGAIQFRMDGARDGGARAAVAAREAGCVSGNADTSVVVPVPAGSTTCTVSGDSYAPSRAAVSAVGAAKSESVDNWTLAAKYAVRGFTVAGTYDVRPDGLTVNDDDADDDNNGKTDDATFWAVRLGYGQDNWSVNAWYGEHNTSDQNFNTQDGTAGNNGGEKAQDTEIFSVSGNVDVGKVSIYAIHDNQENARKQEDAVTVVGVTYRLGSRSRVWVDYASRDFDSDKDAEDFVAIGLRHDF